jgi:hypothetical protein
MTDDIRQFSIMELLTEKVDYVIPMYQRNFAWDEGDITQLIQDVIDYQPDGKSYYIGTLVVAERHESGRTVFETIDGQQRLTTLSLLASYLKHKLKVGLPWYDELRIHFENRAHSSRTFEAIFKGGFKTDPSEVLREQDINTSILNGYRLIAKLLPIKLKESTLNDQKFAEYLFSGVQIMRVRVPDDTDLNHYFEIMNNRGEQLEKHEVLKARMLEVLNDIDDTDERESSQHCLHRVWEACANMEKYVQVGFATEPRNKIFGEKDWRNLKAKDFDRLCEVLGEADDDEANEQTLDEIISGRVKLSEPDEETSDEAPERFNTVINFPNFLLHVLRVVTGDDIPLDDKRLLITFNDYLRKSNDEVKAVKEFIYGLLKCKYLFDKYVIKRELAKGEDRWSLKSFKWIEGGKGRKAGRGSYENTFGEDGENARQNRRILLLLSAFHVSTPTLVYKHWLSASLSYLYNAPSVKGCAYLAHLESVAKAFVYDRFLAPDEGLEYYDIIFENEGVCQTNWEEVCYDNLEERLSFGEIENNLVFNYLDYLLWVENENSRKKVKTISDYEFTFRSSVEHYYPQNPMPGHDTLPPKILHSFGNLCLISHSKNSRLSNFMPAAKKEYYKNNAIDSIKQYWMMSYSTWDTNSIKDHQKKMMDVLINSLQ